MTIKEIRQTLYKNPGVSGEEEFAHDLIVRELQTLNPDELHDHVGGYGVIAFWNFNCEKTLAFRADIDALPSGHRCGHDGHTAIMLRFAQIVSEGRRSCGSPRADCDWLKKLKYNIVLVFQPEEETGKGAKKIMKSGILQRIGVDAIFGLHNLPGYEEGAVVLSRGTFSMASCGVIFRLIGRQTHASTPEMGLNPGLAAAEIIQRMDALNNPKPSNFRMSTLICCRVGAKAFGTSAGKAVVMFTLRSMSNDGMKLLMRDADDIAFDVAQKYGLQLEKHLCEPFRALENTPKIVDGLKAIFPNSINLSMPFRWSEDFAEYLTVFPGAFFGLGSGKHQPELHHPDYIFPDGIIEIGASCFESIMNNIVI